MTADDLGIGIKAKAATGHASSAPDAPEIAANDPRVQEIIRLANQFGGVLLSGPPGTSKSFYAAAAAQHLTGGDNARCRFVQFHASYQYEDFMLGFSPENDGFGIKKGPFLSLAHDAKDDPGNAYVLVIDELSRADVGRVFGEALTYVERSKRELPFRIANGDELVVPTNLIILATMNPFDRGVDEVDAAFERRFAKISMDPSAELLEGILVDNEMDEALAAGVLRWFRRVNEHARKNPAAAVGHAYFADASDTASLMDIWEYQLKYLVQRAFRRDVNTLADVEAAWKRTFVVPAPEGTPMGASGREPPPDPEAGQ
ncbi:McrB family protein [Antrihabitans stalactiti]|uniref:McrB family protein n=1 Tax=Antrihabitans stalactiti TaxID=2584121 RepID=UPI00197CB912|nr:AAA family ATPase [Antrihabitans stalactiti]